MTNSNEDGLLGLGLDPDFESNGYIYVYWSPVHETSPTQNILSRYKMTGDSVDVSSEKRLLRINTQVNQQVLFRFVLLRHGCTNSRLQNEEKKKA